MILNAALTLFSRNGLHGTSAEQIAERADVSKPNLFYYFSSKEEVYVAVLRRLLDEWYEPLEALQPDQEPVAAIGDYIRRKILFSRENPAASRLFCPEIAQGALMLKEEIATSLKRLVDEKATRHPRLDQSRQAGRSRSLSSDLRHLGDDAALR